MARYVCLLRGVNVGGHGKLSMARLREVIESLGHTDVQTLIQSGNVVFTSSRMVTPETIESALEREFGMTVSAMVRTRAELERIVAANPFPDADTGSLHVGFMSSAPSAAAARALDDARFAPEQVVINGRELYFLLPGGIGRAKLPPHVGRRLGVPTTVRNWRTVNRLLELATVRQPRR